ncbi:flavin-binding protein [Spirosoma luteolum]
MATSDTPVSDTKPTQPAGVLSLSDIQAQCWQQLSEAVDAPDHGFRTPVLATATHGGANARTVVLRKVDTDHRYVWFHTDARADKVLELEATPHALLLFWDAEKQIQIRLGIETRLHTDDYVADEHWQALALSSRKMYLSEHPPGHSIDTPYPGFPVELGSELPDKAQSEVGRPNFAVIECRVLRMEYLHLSRAGQARACFQYEPVSQMTWLVP